MSKFRGIKAVRPEAIVHTRRSSMTTIKRAVVAYIDDTREEFLIDDRGRFKLAAITCGEVRRAQGGIR